MVLLITPAVNYQNVLVKLSKSSLISLYIVLIYGVIIIPPFLENCFWSRKLVRISTCSPFRAYTEPLIVVKRILNVYVAYATGTLMYEYMCGHCIISSRQTLMFILIPLFM